MIPVKTIFTDLIPKGITMELDGKIYIGTNETLAKAMKKKPAKKESA